MQATSRQWRSWVMVLGIAVGPGCATSGAFDGDGAWATPGPGRLEGTVTYQGFWPRSARRVAIVLEGVPESPPDATAEVLEIRQIDKHFVPDLAVVVAGTKVTFPNDDRIDHNVFSKSKPTAQFDLGPYKAGTTKGVDLKTPGAVDVFCNIHADMHARVIVVDTRYYTTTESTFAIENIPPGRYQYEVWQAWGKAKTGWVTIEPGSTTSLPLRLKRSRKKRGKCQTPADPYCHGQ